MKVVAFIKDYAAVERIIDGGRGPGLCPGVHFRREGSSLDRDDGLGRGRTVSFAAIFVFLTSIRSRDYPLHAMGGIDSELFRKEYRGALKSKFLISNGRFIELLNIIRPLINSSG
jgi:hypothetical protein